MTGVCLLASYPKSGNTWLRAMLTGLIHDDVDVNDLVGRNVLIEPKWIEDETGVDPRVLSLPQLNELRARLLTALDHRGRCFVKTHSTNVALASGHSLSGSCRAVVIVRHPFDVVVSYADFIGSTIDVVVDALGRRGALINNDEVRFRTVLAESLGSWPEHLASWMHEPTGPRLLVRYEDMRADPGRILRSILEFSDLEASDERIDQAVTGASFDALKAKELRDGFAAKPANGGRMFREGRSGEGRAVLDAVFRELIVESCGPTMEQFGYYEDGGVGAPIVGCA